MTNKIMPIPKETERSGLAKSIGNRMREAREIAGMSQSEAARLLGYANSSKLAKVEMGTDTNSVPLWLIKRASRLYEVSIDFLFGESDDWELSAQACQERDVSKWVFDAWNQARERDMEILRRLNQRFDGLSGAINKSVSASEDVRAAWDRIIALNPKFEDEVRGGGRLLSAIERLMMISSESKAKLQRFKTECTLSKFANQIDSSQGGIKKKPQEEFTLVVDLMPRGK